MRLHLLKKFRKKPTYTHKDAILNVTVAYWTSLLIYKLIAREWYTIEELLERFSIFLLIIALIVLHYILAKWQHHNITLSTRVQNPNSLRMFLLIISAILVVLDILLFSFIV